MSASASFPALGTTAVVVVVDPSGLAAACAAVEDELAAVDAACSRFRDDSELARVNASAGRTVHVGRLLLEALRVALRASDATDGIVSPTLGRPLRLAGYDRDFRLVAHRDADGFEARFEALAPQRVELDEERATVRISPGVELDLGATAKALAADRSVRAAHESAGCGVLVSLGGDVAVVGDAPPDGWSVRIADDHAAALDGAGPVVALFGGGLASSGTTVRRWRSADAELHHIVDPRTGRPAGTPWRTVSVAAASCVDANVASIAAVVLGDAAPAWLAERRLPARLVARDGGAVCIAGWPEDAA